MNKPPLIGQAGPLSVPPRPDPFLPREAILRLCEAAWDVEPETGALRPTAPSRPPPSFHLVGAPGSGRSEVVHELARRIGAPLYMIEGTADLRPEDLALVWVPAQVAEERTASGLSLRASPLAAALRVGGLFFLDGIERVPARTLAPLVSVLDTRCALYSALSGLWVTPESPAARARFRFCCASADAHVDRLPSYVRQRVGPRVEVPPLTDTELERLMKPRRSGSA